MSYRVDYSSRKGQQYKRGALTEEVYDNYVINLKRQKEEKKHGVESRRRSDFNANIAKLIMQGWPKEEIITSIKKQFPDETEVRIEKMAEHWERQYQNAKSEMDKFINKAKEEGVAGGKINTFLNAIYNHYGVLKPGLDRYFKSKMEELEEEI